ncbi:ABC transporter permease [Candidatus Bipolaricaulota bacterium]|nr:ABC transporter permease [Candidatus Bipolaricaulota bacterium]
MNLNEKKDVSRDVKYPRRWATPHLLVGSGIILVILSGFVLSYLYTPYEPYKMNIGHRLLPPSIDHLFGTDQYGRDILSRVLIGSRASFAVGFAAVGIGIGFGVSAGSIAAYFGSWLDSTTMRVIDILYGFPPVITAVIITTISGPGLLNSMLAIGLFNIPIFARITRGNFLSLKERQFVEAARASGMSSFSIITHHIVPNLSSPIIVQATTQFALAILAEAALSYLGLGIQPPHPSWGLMLKQAQSFMGLSPWPAIFPGLAIVLTVLGFNLTGDGLRDLLDPRKVDNP